MEDKIHSVKVGDVLVFNDAGGNINNLSEKDLGDELTVISLSRPFESDGDCNADLRKPDGYTCRVRLSSIDSYHKENYYQSRFKKVNNNIPNSFYVLYTPEFTEDLFNALMKWGKENSTGKIRGYNDTYKWLKTYQGHASFNFVRNPSEKYSKTSYGLDNHRSWNGGITNELSVEQVKQLINYKTSNNGNIKENTNEQKTITNRENSIGGRIIRFQTRGRQSSVGSRFKGNIQTANYKKKIIISSKVSGNICTK